MATTTPRSRCRRARSILQAYKDVDILICPDANALPAAAQAAENLGRAGKVTIRRLLDAQRDASYVKRDTVKAFGLWDVTKQGAISVYVADHLIKNGAMKVGDKLDIPDVGTVEVVGLE